ncbi:MAG TPA: mechanosensitive ion channel family protein [Herpetosiphonaceae bacterium]
MSVWQQALFQIQCSDGQTIAQCLSTLSVGWRESVLKNIPNLIQALIVVAVALFVDDRAQRAVEHVVGLRNEHRELARLLGRMARIGVLLLAALYVLSVFKQTQLVTSFIASLGIAGLVIAFALQDITKNFAAGVLLLILRPFRLDDRIKVKDFEGVVTDVSLRATTLRTNDGEQVLVPNADVYSSPIVNLTRYARRRFHVAISVPATLPIEPVRQQLEAALREIPGLEQEPPPQVVVSALSADAVTLDAQYWLPAQAPDAAHKQSQVIEQLNALAQTLKAQAIQQADTAS